MRFLSPLVFLCSFAFASPGFGDILTPQEVWSDIKDKLSALGDVSEQTTQVSGTLALDQIKIEGAKGGTFVLADQIILKANPNGTVSIKVPPKTAPRWATQLGRYLKLHTTHDRLLITAKGTPDAITYISDAKSFGAGFETRPSNARHVANSNIALDGVELRITPLEDRPEAVEATLNAKSFQTFAASEPHAKFSWSTKSSLNTVNGFLRYDIPEDILRDGINSASFDGLRLDLSMTHGRARQDNVKANGPVETTTASRGKIAFKVLDDHAGLSFRGQDLTGPLKINNGILPTPMRADKFTGSLNLPIGYRDTATEMDVRFNLEGLTFPEILWRMVDPKGGLPRAPIGLNVDLTATGNFNKRRDTLPDAVSKLLKKEFVQNLKINDLNLDILETQLDARGQFSFDHTDVPAGAAPFTRGALDVEVNGLSALIERFSNLGIVPAAQMLAFQAMIGFVATKSDTEDSYKSKIRIAPDGSISANGFRIR